MCMELVLRFGYGATIPWVSRLEDGTMRAVAGPDMAVLRTPVTLWGENFMTRAMFTIAKGKTMPFVLSYGPSHLPVPEPVDPEAALEACVSFWTEWTGSHQDRRPACRRHQALADHAQGADLCAERRHRRRAHHLAARAGRRPAQLGLPLLLDPRFDAHPARPDERRRLRRGDGVARLAAARRRRRSRRHADHVRHHGRAAADRMGGQVAAGLSRVEAGADRQRRLQPVPARRLRRADGHLRTGAQGSAGAAGERLGAAGRADEACRRVLVPARLRHLGDARTAAPLRLFQGDGLGGLRPRRQGDRALRAARPAR